GIRLRIRCVIFLYKPAYRMIAHSCNFKVSMYKNLSTRQEFRRQTGSLRNRRVTLFPLWLTELLRNPQIIISIAPFNEMNAGNISSPLLVTTPLVLMAPRHDGIEVLWGVSRPAKGKLE